MHNIKIPALITIFLLTGCSSLFDSEPQTRTKSDYEIKREARCLHHTGCATPDETPEQFAERKILEDRMTETDQEKSAQREKDMAVCQYEAAKATGSSPRGYSSYTMMFNDMTDTFRQAELMKLCMKSKGYQM